MFAAHDVPPTLRQGDIVSDIFFPLARPAFQKYIGTYASGSGLNIKLEPYIEKPAGSIKEYLLSTVHGVVSPGAIVSQCCDLEPKNHKQTFSICRLVLFERNRFRNIEALTNNIDPYGTERPHIQFFYYGRIDGLEGEYLADFHLLTTCSANDYGLTLKKKLHQLDDLNRNKFRVKVGAAFGRPMQEDISAGLANPWALAAPAVPVKRGVLKRLRGFFGN